MQEDLHDKHVAYVSLPVVCALSHLLQLIMGYNIHVCTDHCAVTEIFKGNNLPCKFPRWQLTVQELNLAIS